MKTLAERGFVILRGAYDRAHAVEETPAILAVVQQIIGREFGVLYSGLREPTQGRGQQGLHQDWMRRSPHEATENRADVATVLAFLDDFGPDNGATGVIPGSHRWPHPLPKAQQQAQAAHPEEIQVEGKAGDVLIFSGHLWHRGRENRSGSPRRAIQVQFCALDRMPPSAATIIGES
jgi:ectoine hydroxylase-related dioxygenase (phytanoyl-CoA dioxygenase family)